MRPAFARRLSLAAVLLACTLAPAVRAAPGDLVMAICEGTFSSELPIELVEKYQPIAQAIGKALKANVIVSPVCHFGRLEAGLAAERFDLAMARPSDYLARAIRDNGYRFVARSTPDVQCVFLVPRDSPLKSLAQVAGQRIVVPDGESYMGKLCRAELRESSGDAARSARFVKEQAVVMHLLKAKEADVGGLSSYSKAVAPKALEAAGLRELARGRPQPYLPVIVSRRFTEAQVASLRKELTGLSATAEGRARLQRAGLTGFDGTGAERMAELLAWLEKP